MSRYYEARQTIFATGIVPNGFTGDFKCVSFGVLDNKILVIWKGGFYRIGIQYDDINNALDKLKACDYIYSVKQADCQYACMHTSECIESMMEAGIIKD